MVENFVIKTLDLNGQDLLKSLASSTEHLVLQVLLEQELLMSARPPQRAFVEVALFEKI